MNQNCQNTPPLTSACIDWQDGVPVSRQFEDVYFSRDDGAAETRYVFVGQNRLPQRWQDWQTPGSFVIGETGFGTGLNFLCAWELWQQLRQPGQHLHFVSVEKFPLSRNDLEQAGAARPEFSALFTQLLAQYPSLVRGSHRLHFPDEQLTLTLIFDDAITAFTALDGVVDAWFLDGFAPARNPDMWQPDLFAQMARLSHAGTTFATFTSAGLVKRGLRDAGFHVEKCAGYGRKRDMLRGQLSAVGTDRPAAPAEFSPAQLPWFQYRHARQAPGTVAIIGAGLAGCATAFKLAQRGWQVTVFEAENRIAQQASGNPTGITYTRLSVHDSPQNRYYQFAYLYACRFLLAFFAARQMPAGTDWNLNGVLQLAWDDNEKAEQELLLQSGVWPTDVVEALTAEQVSQHLNLPCPHPALLMKNGGWLNPATLCAALLQDASITVRTGFHVETFTPDTRNNRWQINDESTSFDAVVLANTFASSQYAFTQHLPLRWVRGQISYIPATPASQQLQHAINYDGYLNPARDGFHCIGATFNPKDRDPQERDQDHQKNLQQLRDTWPQMAALLNLNAQQPMHGRVGFRCQTPDYLPVIGPLPHPEQFQQDYADIGKGFLKRSFGACPNLPGFFINTGHGSKGITSSLLAAEILAGYITGEPQAVDRAVLQAVHPARFLIRSLKRRQG